jgi:magnesium-transporting ATPase (P-type)
MVAGGFALFLWEKSRGMALAEARTVVVNVIVMVELFYLLNCRSLTRSFFSLKLLSNLWVAGGVAAMLMAQLLFTYTPFMNKLFHSAPISGLAWLKIIGVGLIVFAAVELKKWLDAPHSGRGAADRSPQNSDSIKINPDVAKAQDAPDPRRPRVKP